MNKDQITGVIRHTMTGAGVAGATMSHDDFLQILSGLITLLSIIWSVLDKRRNGGGSSGGPMTPAAAALLFCAPLAGSLLTGCTTPQNFLASASTPERIEAVSALAAYAGGKAAIASGHGLELAAAVEGLKMMQASGKADLAAVGTALQAAGIDKLGSSEGALIVGAALVFQDLWAQTAQPVLDDARARALVNGLLRGFNAAMTAPRGPDDPVHDQLVTAAISSRPAR